MKVSKYSLIITIILIIILFFFIPILIKHNKKLNEITNLYKISQDSITFYRNSLGQQVAKIEPLIVSNEKYFLEIKSNNQTIKELQSQIKEETKKRHNVEVAMIIKDQTIFNLQDSLKNKIIGYVKKDSLVYPTYEHKVSDKWINQDIQLGINTFKQKLIINNEYDIIIGQEPDGWFKTKSFAQVTNINPYTSINTFKVYQKKEVPSKLWSYLKGSIIGAGIMVLVKTL